jgi:hypothetical protein
LHFVDNYGIILNNFIGGFIMGLHSNIYDEQDWFKYNDKLYDKYLDVLMSDLSILNMDKFIWGRYNYKN